MSPIQRKEPSARHEQLVDETRLSGRTLAMVRIAWVLVFVSALGIALWSVPVHLYRFEHPTAQSTELAPHAVAALGAAGISLHAYALVIVGLECIIMAISAIMALILFVRRGNDWMVLLVSLFLIFYPAAQLGPTDTISSAPTGPTLQVSVFVLEQALIAAVVYSMFLLFPSGRWVPGWSRWLLIAFSAWSALITAAPDLLGGLLFVGYPIFFGVAIYSQVHRYRRISTPVQRLQTKWVVTSIILALVANQAFWISGVTSLGQTLYPPLAFLGLYLAVLLVPIACFIAVQRHRLYEIDVIINKALVYGSLTAILAAVYGGVIVALQQIVRALAGTASSENPVIIVISTLLIAALFQPLRHRLQRMIDRRFFRSKYDAAKTLAAFSVTLRNETDLPSLTSDLIGVVEETLHPAHVSLWLRPRHDREVAR